MSASSLSFDFVLLPDGLARDKRLSVDDKGRITAVEDAPPGSRDGWLALPGMVNAHSHAFQRAITGFGERAGGEASFWGWRESMYRLAARVTPRDLEAIAAQAYTDMLRGGYTSVAEFHYLHHGTDGAVSTAMADALISAAARTGIRLFLLPVFYARGGFGQPPDIRQRRFVHHDVAGFLEMLQTLAPHARGIAPHSLRAVPVDWLPELVAGADAILGDDCPIHIHIAEQRREVDECRAHHGATPIKLLADHVDLNRRWSLVHATHADDDELQLMAGRRANVILCPLTEAYLGDGVFPAVDFQAVGGIMGIGSDSNTRIDALEELRLLEYGQRLTTEQRPCLSGSQGLGATLWSGAAMAGARSVAEPLGELAPGHAADIVVLDPRQTPLAGMPVTHVLDALVVGGDARVIADVYVAGERRVEGGDAHGAEAVASAYAGTLDRLALDT